jgi:hypothetical protein
MDRPARRVSLGAAPAALLSGGAGLLLVALGNRQSLMEGAHGALLFWTGIVVIVGSVAVRLFGRGADRDERIALVLGLGLALFLVKVLHSPSGFTRFDEFGWWRETHDLVVGGHPFQADPLNPAAAGYPALATITGAIAQTTGLSIFISGLIVIGVAKAALMLFVFLLLERIVGSARAAGIGALIYACNSSFLYFDSQFSYESLALAFAVGLLLVVERWSRLERGAPRQRTAAVAALYLLLAAALTVTHHLTSIFVVFFLLAWAFIRAFADRRRQPAERGRGILLPAALIALMIAVWLAFVAGHSTVAELGDFFSGAGHSISELVLGKSGSKRPFSGTGETTNLLERGLIVVYVIGVTALIAVGLLRLWRRRERDPLMLTLAALAAFWPVGLALRLTQASTEISGRAPEFVFLGAGFLGAYLVAHPRPRSRRMPALPGGRAIRPVAAAAFSVVVLAGGFIFGELKATRQPGPFLVGAEDRSVTPQGIAAAQFAAANLPGDGNVLADRNNATLLGSYGGLYPAFGSWDGSSVSTLLLDPQFVTRDYRIVRGRALDYVVVDHRLKRALPIIGFYVDSEEPAPVAPPSEAALSKFGSVPGVSKIYANGPIAIYGLQRLLR